MNKAIFLDRDGTLNEDSGYTYKIEDYILLPGVIEGLKKLKEYKLFIISNQSGIGRGYYTEEDMHKFNEHLLKDLRKNDIEIEKIYYCPHSPEQICDCRKPNIKYIKKTEEEFGIDIANSFVIGDHSSDVKLAKNAGCKSVYLLTGHGAKHLEESRKQNPDYISADFAQAVNYIIANNTKKIIARNDLKKIVAQLKKEKKKIVTLNGTFDVLHTGHEYIVKEAKKQGDILIVGLNTDNSVKRNKGPLRPINNEHARAIMLTQYSEVDYVTLFDEETPIEMLEIIKPNIHVNGSEYGKECIESSTVKKNGGEMYIVNLLPGYSTTKMTNIPKKSI